MRFATGLLLAGSILASTATNAETTEETAALFGARQSVLGLSLSPSGKKFAYISPAGSLGERLFVVDLTKEEQTPKAIFVSQEPNAELSRCNWATEDRLVCRADFIGEGTGYRLGFSRMYSIGDDGSDLVRLTASDSTSALGIQQHGGSLVALDVPDKDRGVLMTRDWVEEVQVGTRLANAENGLGVELVDVYSGRRRTVEKPDEGAVSYVADENGRVRLKVRQTADPSGYTGSRRNFYYRSPTSDRWELLSRAQVDSQTYVGFMPVAVDSSRNLAYGYMQQSEGHEAIYSIALDDTGTMQPVLQRDDADVDDLIRIGRQRRVIGASYATEKRKVEYFDPALAKLAKQLEAALPGKPLINFVDANADETKLLIIASSDTDPGMVYLLDRQSLQLSEVMPIRRELEGRTMNPMTPVSFPASDGTIIPGYLTLPEGQQSKIKAIVLPHGGPSSRDEWGFDWMVQFFTARGYAVLQPNFRGSSGLGADWFGENGFKAWKTAIGDVNDAGRWLISQGIADPDHLSIIGWSYGGYAALQSQVLDASLYKSVVAIAPVSDLQLYKDENRNFTSYGLVSDFVGNGPHISEGSPADHADAFKAPVLLFHGTNDQNVGVAHSRKMRDRLKNLGKKVSYVEFADRDHNLDDSEARTEMLKDIDIFISSNSGS